MERIEPFDSDLGADGGHEPISVLVIEVSEYTASLLAESRGAARLSVNSVRDTRQALRRLRNEHYDVIVVNLPAPQMGAEEFFRSVVAFDLEQASRVVFLTSDLADPKIRRFLTLAGRPFLTHPVDPRELHDLVMRVGTGPPEP
jgi:DNA-binding response OmpR family regulator